MTAPDVLHAAAVARLNTISHVTIYDGNVDSNPPADSAGYVLPYIVVWPSGGVHPAEARTPGDVAGDGTELDWMLRINCAGGDVARALQAVTLARGVLLGHQLVPGAGYLIEEPTGRFDVLIDRDVTPTRHFVPLLFRTLTP